MTTPGILITKKPGLQSASFDIAVFSNPQQADALGSGEVQELRVQLQQLIPGRPRELETDRAEATLKCVDRFLLYTAMLETQAVSSLAPVKERFHLLQTPADDLHRDLTHLMRYTSAPFLARALLRYSAIDFRNASKVVLPQDSVLALEACGGADVLSPHHTRENLPGVQEKLLGFVDANPNEGLGLARQLALELHALATGLEVWTTGAFRNDAPVGLSDLTVNVEKVGTCIDLLADTPEDMLNHSDWSWITREAGCLNSELERLARDLSLTSAVIP